MPSPPAAAPKARLQLAAPRREGGHTSDQLSSQVDRGELLRIRRGCYFPTDAWLRSPPWDRHLIASAATALTDPSAILCRETALAVYGVPLLKTPTTVQIRTPANERTGRRHTAGVTGSAAPKQLARKWTEALGEQPRGSGWLRRMEVPAVKRIQFPLPLRAALRGDLTPSASRRYYSALREASPAHGEFFAPGRVGLTVEPLALAAVDTVCQMSMADGVVVLDAILAGRHRAEPLDEPDPFAGWLDCIPSARARRRWEAARNFADPRSESPGESLSRVVIAQLGFQVPALQHEITLPDGTRRRTDFWWERSGIVGEFDGRQKYTRARELSGGSATDVVIEERRRERDIEQQGYRMVRWGWPELHDPDRMHALLLGAGVPRS